jgi:hypothetical protein
VNGFDDVLEHEKILTLSFRRMLDAVKVKMRKNIRTGFKRQAAPNLGAEMFPKEPLDHRAADCVYQ